MVINLFWGLFADVEIDRLHSLLWRSENKMQYRFIMEALNAKSESLAQIRTIMAEIQHFFQGIVFFIGAPCMFRSTSPSVADPGGGGWGHAPPAGGLSVKVLVYLTQLWACELVIHHFWSQKMATSGNYYINTVKTAFKWRTSRMKLII